MPKSVVGILHRGTVSSRRSSGSFNPRRPFDGCCVGPFQSSRPYTRTSLCLDDTTNKTSEVDDEKRQKREAAAAARLAQRMAAHEYNSRRASYKRQVSLLRKEYAEEVARQRAIDKAEKEALERELTRKRLERQRLKNLRSAENAFKQDEIRKRRAEEFQEHLRQTQAQREAKHELYVAARQLVIDELEREAPLWLTTPEEVEAAFTPEAEQLLWSRPGGVLGAPNPSLDSHFWQFETHTWHMDRTYKSQRDVLLERLEDMAYDEANVDDAFWTDERVEERRRLEEKARLRGMVHSAGRAELLRRQRQILAEDSSVSSDGIPKSKPVPSLRVLQNHKALEIEGSRLLMEDPTKFFVFDGAASSSGSTDRDRDDSNDSAAPTEYSGPALGAPVALRDPLRESSHQESVFPTIIGRIPPADTRTEREKKREEREDRMWAAAQAEKRAAEADIELAAEGETLDDLEPDVSYDELEDQWDWQEEDWKKGLDPVADSVLLNMPRELRYTEDDIEWVSSQLEGKLKHLEQQLRYDLENLKHSVESEARAGSGSGADKPFEEASVEAALLALSEQELIALSDLDDRYSEGMSDEELRSAMEAIPGLTEEQVRAVLARDKTSSQ